MSLKKPQYKYTITENTSGLVFALFGRFVFVYPFWRMTEDFKKFDFFSTKKDIVIHLGLLGIHLGTTKI
jgi:hypothetical protein